MPIQPAHCLPLDYVVDLYALQKRDYLQNRSATSWLYMSRLAALKEFAFMKALYDNGFPTPVPIDCNRHCVLMSLVKGIQLQHVAYLRNPQYVYDQVHISLF
jgi:RIO kinase 2